MVRHIRQIVVVGGGSAGWLTACMIAVTQASLQIQVTLVESPNIPTIGVGEGSWPSMRHTLDTIGIKETTFVKRCHASFKQGSKFINWATDTSPNEYYHPFTVPLGYTELDVAAHWQAEFSNQPYSYAFCPQSAVCDLHLAPKQLATPDYAFVTNYGYHFDAARLTELLTEHGTGQLGIRHVVDNVSAVVPHANGDIAALETASGKRIEGDLFIDCSGQKGLLIAGHYHIPWLRRDKVLINDSAIAAQVPYGDPQQDIHSCTLATAHPHGWSWDIGLFHRRGIGYSYASGFASSSQAEQQLREHIHRETGVSSADVNLRHLSFTPGYRSEFWHRNCLAIGMSAGFIEPLEASALAMVELSVTMLTEAFPHTSTHMAILAKRFNQRFAYRWERVIDFIKLHYVLSTRGGEYWLAQRAASSIPERLRELLTLWQYQAPSRNDLYENEEVFSSASYQYVLYGMGFTSRFSPSSATPELSQQAAALFNRNREKVALFCAGLPTNRAYLNRINA